MKISQVVNALPSLQRLAEQELSIKKLYKISKLINSLEKDVEFYNIQREKILSQYCDLHGNRYVPRVETQVELEKALDELFGTDIECEVKEVVLSTDEDVKLSYNDLLALKGFVSIEE